MEMFRLIFKPGSRNFGKIQYMYNQLPRVGGDSIYKKVGMLVENFEIDP